MGLFDWFRKKKEKAGPPVQINEQPEVEELPATQAEPEIILETAELPVEQVEPEVAEPIQQESPEPVKTAETEPAELPIEPDEPEIVSVKQDIEPEKTKEPAVQVVEPQISKEPKKKGFFGKIFSGLKKTREAVAYKINKLFTGGVLNDEFYEELEAALISSDMGAETTDRIMEELREAVDKRHIRQPEGVKEALQEIIEGIMEENEPEDLEFPAAIMIVGVNGVGKTTSIGKLAAYYKSRKKSVMIAAADTFRAAAAEQLAVWADRADARMIKHGEGGDPAAVVFDAIKSAQAKNTDALIIDTAGRLHNKANLMEELKKIARVVRREYPEADYRNYIVLDATTGQNAIAQVETFDEAVDLDGIIITKLDGTAKGGVLVALADRFALPIYFTGVGEGLDDLVPFDAKEFAQGILE